MYIARATEKQLEKWDHFVENSINGTIFHKRKFLQYHGDKFKNGEQFLVLLNGSEVYAQIAIHVTTDGNGKKHAASPYGASYGGFVFSSAPTYKIGKEIIILFLEYLKDISVMSFKITQPSNFYCKQPLDTFILNMLEQGFISYNRDILNVMDLNREGLVIDLVDDYNCRRKIRKAKKDGIVVKFDSSVEQVYPIIKQTSGKFGCNPTHSFEELKWLCNNFKDEIYFTSAHYGDILIAAVTNFEITKQVNSSFYLSTDADYLRFNGLRYAICEALQYAKNRGFQYYDFGTSSAMLQGNEKIFATKEGFSRVGLFRETLEWINSD